MTLAFVTGIGGQDGSYLAERLLADGVEVHALAHEAEPLPDAPGVVLHTGDLTRTDEVRALLLDLAPDEVYNLAAISSVAQSWAEPDLTARVNGTAAVALLESARQVAGAHGRPVRFVQASSAEIFGEPDRQPAGRVDADPAREPVRRREGLRAPHGRRLPPPRPARRQRDPLQPRVAAPAGAVRDPQDHLDRGRHRPGSGGPARRSATSTPGATGAGRPTTSTRWCAPPAPTSRATT